ncbi:DNMAP1/SANT/Myb-like domain containing protein [Cryptosporidium hominis]|uniref:DNMAP1/SANT/Myb-like domain containing protein n=1 Tax=Cryptosporidium hominis TaxID=237895 RepID=A0ABX5BAL8_CRYHO|nr:DNMAP1/SANT/Myb-like domain containing protein [Cryptosporidium hominis]|eukprot:PPS94138.1 DNMAP1/SANT/Myb-like domain containing protein [Cryptosporidium hominis]
MGPIIRDILGVTPNIKIVSQMNEKLKNDDSLGNYGKKALKSPNLEMVSIPINTSIGISSKQKPISNWEWVKFRNSARNDSLKLYHWSKVQSSNKQEVCISGNKELNLKDKLTKENNSVLTPTDDTLQKDSHTSTYYFSKFNKHPTIYSIQSDQYNKFIKDIDPDWTEDDTYLLFDLCKEFDLRFIVIHDRYIPPSGKQRTLEQLKQRYYSVSKKLVELSFDSRRRALGNSPDPSILASLKEERSRHPYIRYSYNFEQDRNRRIALIESFNDRNTRKNAKKIISDIQPKPNQHNNKKGSMHIQKCVGDLVEIENEIEQEFKFISKLKLHDSFGPKKSGVTTVGALCFQYISNLPRKFSSDVENFLKHFKLDIFPLPFLNIEVAEQYCAMRCDLLILLSTRKKLQRLNSFRHAWQEKLRNAIIQNDEFGHANQVEQDEKNRSSLVNSSGRQYHASVPSPALNNSRSFSSKTRGKSIRMQEQTSGQIVIPDINNISIATQFNQNNEAVKRDTELIEKPRKRSKSNVSRFLTQQNGFSNQHGTHLSSIQILNGQAVATPTNSAQNEQFLLHNDSIIRNDI